MRLQIVAVVAAFCTASFGCEEEKHYDLVIPDTLSNRDTTDWQEEPEPDPTPRRFTYDELSDMVAVDATHVLATNVMQNSVDLIDVTTGEPEWSCVIGGNPSRLVLAGASKALVVHGREGPTRLDVVKIRDDGSCYSSILLLNKEHTYVGIDVTWSADDLAYVLVIQSGDFFQEGVLMIDLSTNDVSEYWELENIISHKDRILYADDSLFIGTSRTQRNEEGSPDLIQQVGFESNWQLPNKLQVSPDGLSTLFCRNNSVLEYDSFIQGMVVNQYDLLDRNAYGAHDFAYTSDGMYIVALNLDYDTFITQVFDRHTSTEKKHTEVGPDSGTISYTREFMTLSADDRYAFVYVYDDFWIEEYGWFLPVSITVE